MNKAVSNHWFATAYVFIEKEESSSAPTKVLTFWAVAFFFEKQRRNI